MYSNLQTVPLGEKRHFRIISTALEQLFYRRTADLNVRLIVSVSFVSDNGHEGFYSTCESGPSRNPLHCRVVRPDNAGHCPPAEISLIVCILCGPYEHSLAFRGQLRSHFALVNNLVVFGETQRVGLILKGGWSGVCQRRWGGGNIWEQSSRSLPDQTGFLCE